MTLEEKCKIYFDAFSRKDLLELADMLSDDVILKDWEVLVEGRVGVLDVNGKLFHETSRIRVELIKQASSNKTVFNQINVVINDLDIISVIDVIEFDNSGLIKRIEAYRC